IALYNENYSMPEIPKGVDEKDILNGIYLYKEFQSNEKDSIESTVDLLGSGPIMQQVLKAAEILSDRGINCRVWSVTSYGELYRKCSEFERVQRLTGYQSESVYSILEGSTESVVVAASDNIQAVPELIRPWVLGRYIVLGTDGFGRSDTRTALRRFFEVDSEHIVLAALAGLVQKGTIDIAIFDATKQEFGLDVEREDVTNF
ncbi:MAG: pyruvate dehydrogenase (acetyl-transferring), homodimeric type, partial [Candidatus Thermoplasmatota archaeon]|nr:pyruvate dehydrogenase (acetyl-transferring), homodimeric type [Candidatus Thermoplasmatota archaeon]